MQLKKSYYIATNVSSRIIATTFGDLPDCWGAQKNGMAWLNIMIMASSAANVKPWCEKHNMMAYQT